MQININETQAECSYKQFVPLDGTFSLGNTIQRDKTTKDENICNMQAE